MDMIKFYKKYPKAVDLGINTEYMPCYMLRYEVDTWINTEKIISEYIKACIHEAYREQKAYAVMFSVTEKDLNHKLWVEYAKKKGYYIVPSISRHGPYKCWCIIVNRNKRLKI